MRVIRLRATAALTAAVLLPLAVCAAPDDGTTPGAATTSSAPAQKEDRAAPPSDVEADDDELPEDLPDAAPVLDTTGLGGLSTLGPIDPALGAGHTVSQTDIPAEQSALVRADPSTAGAELTATLFTAAWSDALQTGDGTGVRSLSLDTCTFCASVADTSEATPLGPDLHLVTTIWPITSMPPTTEYPNTTVVAGTEFLVVRPSGEGNGVNLESVTHRRQLLRIGMAWIDGTWAVHGVDSEPWDGSNPLAS